MHWQCRIRCSKKLEERRQQFEQQGQEAFAKEYSQIYGIVMELLDKMSRCWAMRR